MPVHFHHSQLQVRDILDDSSIEIPLHQRPEIWNEKHKSELINSVLLNFPMPSFIFYDSFDEGKRIRALEDGQQRYWSLVRYKEDKFMALTASGDKKLYSELDPDERAQFNRYCIDAIIYENATKEERLHMFQHLQNGIQLTSGQRFHAMLPISPIVAYAMNTFMGGNERVAKVFGFGNKPIKDTPSKTQLQNAMAIAGGLALGPSFITTSYDILGPELVHDMSDQSDYICDTLFTIYETAQKAKNAWNVAQVKKYHWPVGKITGYILWSILECLRIGGDMQLLINAWVSFLTHIHSDINKLAILHKDKPSSRNWTSERWHKGFHNVFVGGPGSAFLNEDAIAEYESENDQSSDTDSNI